MKSYFFILFLLGGCSEAPVNCCSFFNGWAMTMPYHITIGKVVNKNEHLLIQSIVQSTFDEIDQTVNNWNSNSEVSLINRSPANTTHKISKHLNHLLTVCGKISVLSEGRFDPTIEPLTKLWKNATERGVKPDSEALEGIRKAIGWSHIHLASDILWKDESQTALDLCALSKGYCIDLITERLTLAGFEDLFIEWAGEIRASGGHPTGRKWTVQIEPNKEQITLTNGAIATSGDYAQAEWGDGYFHIIDPISCSPMRKKPKSIKAVTVIAPTCVLADSLATTLMLFQTKEEAAVWAEEIVKQIPEVSFRLFN